MLQKIATEFLFRNFSYLQKSGIIRRLSGEVRQKHRAIIITTGRAGGMH